MDTILRGRLEAGEGPKYRRIVEGIAAAIGAGTLAPGEKLPPVRELAWTLGVTPGTVARAFTILGDTGWVTSEVGRGTFVAARADARSAAHSAARPGPPSADPAPEPGPVAALHTEYPEEGDVFVAPRLPDVGQLALIREGLAQAAALPDERMLNYPSFENQLGLRRAVWPWLPRDMQAGVDPDGQIVMTAGGQSAIMLALQTLFVGDRPTVLAERLTYPGLRRAAEALRAEVRSVEMDAEGVIPEALEEAVRETGARAFFTMPEAQNPTCQATSNARRERVAEVAARTGLHLLQDDAFRLGPPAGPSYRALIPEQGWFLSTLSKAISPALRAGYVVAPTAEAARLRRVSDANSFGLSTPVAALAEYLFAHPETPAAVERVRRHMRAYVEVAVNVLGRFDLGWHPDMPYVWLQLPANWREAAFVQALEGEGIRVRPGDDFAARNAPSMHAVRIAVNGRMSLDAYRDAMERIAARLDAPPERAMG